jgi:hypothetical protein
MSVEELIRVQEEMLRTDPEYRGQAEAVEAAREERVRRLREAAQPIVADLRAVGVQVESVWDLVNTSEPYFAALPVLMEHFERGGYPDRVMESVGRALAVKPSVAYWDRLKARYVGARSSGEEEGAAIALAACVTKAQVADLIGLLDLEERGESRVYFLRPIKRLGGEAGKRVLTSLVDDPELGKEAAALLRVRGERRS